MYPGPVFSARVCSQRLSRDCCFASVRINESRTYQGAAFREAPVGSEASLEVKRLYRGHTARQLVAKRQDAPQKDIKKREAALASRAASCLLGLR